MSADPELSVVVVNHNGAACLPDTLQALVEHTRATVEVIVVDSASSDGSWRGLERAWAGTRVERFEDNIGFAAGCNRGAEAARGPLLAFVNFDGRVEPDWDVPLRALLGIARASRWRPGCSSPPTAGSLEAVGLEIAPNTATYGRQSEQPRASAPSEPISVAAASGALMMVRRDDFLALGGFFEPLWMYGEEADYCLRALDAWRRHASSRQRDPPRARGHASGPTSPRSGCTGRAATG